MFTICSHDVWKYFCCNEQFYVNHEFGFKWNKLPLSYYKSTAAAKYTECCVWKRRKVLNLLMLKQFITVACFRVYDLKCNLDYSVDNLLILIEAMFVTSCLSRTYFHPPIIDPFFLHNNWTVSVYAFILN